MLQDGPLGLFALDTPPLEEEPESENEDSPPESAAKDCSVAPSERIARTPTSSRATAIAA